MILRNSAIYDPTLPRGQYVPPNQYPVVPHFARLLPEAVARSSKVVPLTQEGDVLVVAMANPKDAETVSLLRKLTAREILPVLSSDSEIEAALDRIFAPQEGPQLWKVASRVLLAAGVLTTQQVASIEKKSPPRSAAEVERGGAAGLLTEDEFLEALGLALYLPRVHLDRYDIVPAFARIVPRDLAEESRVIALFPANGHLLVASPGLPPPEVLDRIRKLTGYEPRPVLCGSAELQRAIERSYPASDDGREPPPKPLWAQLVEDGVVHKEQIASAQIVERQTGIPVEEQLLKLGRVTELQLLEARARLYGTQLVRPVDVGIDMELARVLPEPLARHYRCVILRRVKRGVQVAMVYPGDANTRRMLEYLMGQPVDVLMCTEARLQEAIRAVYSTHRPVSQPRRTSQGEYLVLSGRLTAAQVSDALALQQKTGHPLGRCLVECGLLDEDGLAEALALQHRMPWVSTSRYTVQPETVKLIPEQLARQLGVLPLYLEGRVLTVATADPEDETALRTIEQHTGLDIRPVLAARTSLLETIDRLYRIDLSTISKELQGFGNELVRSGSLSREQLYRVWSHQLQAGVAFDEALSALGFLSEDQLADALARYLELPRAELRYRMEPATVIDGLGRRRETLKWSEPLGSEVARLLPEAVARRFAAIPFRQVGNTISVAFADPLEESSRRSVEERLGCPISIHVANRSQVMEAIRRVHNRRTLGDLLVESDRISRRQLQEGLELHRRTGIRLGKALVNLGYITQEEMVSCLSEQLNLPHYSMSGVEIPGEIARCVPESLARGRGLLPLARRGDILTLAMTDPLDTDAIEEVERITGCRTEPVITTDDEMEEALEGIYRDDYLWTSANDLVYRYPDESAARVLTTPQKLIGLVFLAISAVLFALDAVAYITFLVAASTLFYLCFSTYKFYLIYKALSHKLEIDVSADEIDALDDRDLPVYTVLVPLYREAEVMPTLVRAIDALDYPKPKLDVKLLLEEDDTETIEAIRRVELPAHFKVVVVPNSQPKGKPKACNYGLLHAQGEYVVIYDAEDVPDPNQLKMAVLAFRKAGERVSCIQAKLNYYNRNQNLLTRWFTTEYSMWFDLFIPGLDASNAPIPLGGTSNHFRTAQLRELGAWDPYNVTEDADLGVRLFKAGGKTAVIDSTTYEEANSEIYNWIRQRSRWVKGYIQTWLVHMRHPFKLIREIGFYQFFSFNMVVGGTFFGFLMNPVYWLLTAAWFLTRWELIQLIFPRPIFYLGSLALYFGNFAFMYTNVAGCMRRGYYDMVKYALISPLYWALMSVGAWKGFLQLFYRPSYWEKTKHGLYRGDKQKTSEVN